MAYIPPHKRHSRDAEHPAPSPASLAPHFNKSLTLGRDRPGSSQHRGAGWKIIYAPHSISRWWPAGAPPGADPIPAAFRLEPFPCEPVERKDGAKPLILASAAAAGGDPVPRDEKPWEAIAKRVAPDLAALARSARGSAVEAEGEVKMCFVARVGKVYFRGSSVSLESIRKAAAAETDSSQQPHNFYTNIPNDYMEDIEHSVVPRIGFDFELQKEYFQVKVYDKFRPDSTISCKCTLAIDVGKLKIHKIELNQVRHLLVDISCLYKDLDLRLMLFTKSVLKVLSNEEKDGINKLIESAVIDPDVKGGLRWPLGKESAAERFSVVGVWHTKHKIFKSPAMRLKLRHADRFDYRTSTGEVSSEVTLKLTAMSEHLRDGDAETGALMEMVEDGVKLFWNHL